MCIVIFDTLWLNLYQNGQQSVIISSKELSHAMLRKYFIETKYLHNTFTISVVQ